MLLLQIHIILFKIYTETCYGKPLQKRSNNAKNNNREVKSWLFQAWMLNSAIAYCNTTLEGILMHHLDKSPNTAHSLGKKSEYNFTF